MHKRFFYASLALGLSGVSAIADNSVCEYWLDYDYAKRGTAAVTDGTAGIQLDIRSLTPGLHYLSLWPKSDAHGAGSVMRTAFFTMTSETKTKLKAIEYWLNNDYNTRIIKSLSTDSIAMEVDVKHLPSGMHFFNCRAIDSAGAFGPIMRTMLYISPLVEPEIKATHCETWIDDGFTNRQRRQMSDADSIIAITHDISALGRGMHFFNYRAVGATPGPVMRTMFYIASAPETISEPSYCESWIDSDFNARKVMAVSETDSTVTVSHDLNNLAPGMHFFNYRAVGATPGPVMRTMFYIASAPETISRTSYCESWIDGDFNARKVMAVSETDSTVTVSHDLNNLAPGMHFFNYRAVGAIPGPVMRTMFYVPQPSRPDVACIKYWIDDRDPIVERTTGNAFAFKLDLEGLDWGEHTFHLVAEDSWGNPGEEFTAQFTLKDVSEVVEDAEWQLLMALYDQLVARGWKDPWDMSCGPEGAYALRGITVTDSHVTELQLPDEDIQGTFPTASLTFPHLEKLDLSSNNLSNTLPSEGAIAEALTSLDLSHNRLEGNAGTLAARFPNLQALDLSHNRLSEVSPPISHNVETLDLGHQEIPGTYDLRLYDSSTIPSSLPSIVTYDHLKNTYTDTYAMALSIDDMWSGKMEGDGADFAITPTQQGIYPGTLDDTLTADTDGGHRLSIRLKYADGDTNLDGNVDVADLQSQIMHIFESQIPLFAINAADMWADGSINVQDVAAMAHYLATRDIAEDHRQKLASNHNVSDSPICYISHGSIYISSAHDVAAFDIIVDGCAEYEASETLRKAGFICKVNYQDHALHIVAYSPDNKPLPAGISEIFTVGDASLRYAKIVDPQAQEILTASNPSSIEDVSSEFGAEIQARKLRIHTDSSLSDVIVSLLAPDGRIVHQSELGHVDAGTSYYQLDCISGIYIVRIEAESHRPVIFKTLIK